MKKNEEKNYHEILSQSLWSQRKMWIKIRVSVTAKFNPSVFFLPLFWLCKINSTYFHMRKSLFFSIIFLFYFVRRLMNLLRGWCTIYTPHAKNKVYIFLLSSHSNSCDKSSGFFSSVFVLLDKYEKLFRSVVHQWYCWEIISLEKRFKHFNDLVFILVCKVLSWRGAMLFQVSLWLNSPRLVRNKRINIMFSNNQYRFVHKNFLRQNCLSNFFPVNCSINEKNSCEGFFQTDFHLLSRWKAKSMIYFLHFSCIW